MHPAVEPGTLPDNYASNRVSQTFGYEPNGTGWATRRGDAAVMKRWKLTRDDWARIRRDDIEFAGVQECLPVLELGIPAGTVGHHCGICLTACALVTDYSEGFDIVIFGQYYEVIRKRQLGDLFKPHVIEKKNSPRPTSYASR